MHYGVPKSLTGLAATKPAYGLAEATASGAARYAEVEADVVELLTKLSGAFATGDAPESAGDRGSLRM